MPPDQLGQFVQNIPPDQLDHIHQALQAIRSGSYGGKSFDTSAVDQDKLGELWSAVHGRVSQRDTQFGENALPDSSLGEKASALGHKFMDAVTAPGTAGATATEFAKNHPIASAMLGPASMLVSGAVMKPSIDIQKLETPGYSQEHPFMHGVAGGASGMTSPFVAASAGVAGTVEAALPRISAWATRVFTAQMAMGNYQQAKKFAAAVQAGDKPGYMEAAGEFASTFPFTAMGAVGSLPRGKVSGAAEPGVAPEPTPGPSTAPTAVLSGREVPKAPDIVKAPLEAYMGTPKAQVEPAVVPEAVHQAEAAKVEAKPNPAAEVVREAPKTPKDIVEGAGLVYKGELVPGTGVHQFEESDRPGETATIKTAELTPEGIAANVQRSRDAWTKKAPTPESRISEIDELLTQGAKGTKTPEEKIAWAEERTRLMTEKAGLQPPATAETSPLDRVKAAVLQTVTPEANPRMDPAEYRGKREEALTKAVDESGLGPDELRAEASKAQTRADLIDHHLGLTGYKDQLAGMLRAIPPVLRTVSKSFVEEGETETEEGEDRPTSRVTYDASTGSPLRTVIRMLQGAQVKYRRVLDPITGRVERDLRTSPRSPEEVSAGEAAQAELAKRVGDFQSRKVAPNPQELKELEGLAIQIESTTGKYATYAGKGGLDSPDPNLSALNELVGRGAGSKLSKPLDRAPVVRDRLRDAASLLRSHADRLEGVETKPQATEQAPVPVATPVTTPSEPAIEAPIDHAKIREVLLGHVEAFENMRADPDRWEEVPVARQKVLEKMGPLLEKAADDPAEYVKLPEAMRKNFEQEVREADAREQGTMSMGVNPVAAVSRVGRELKSWFDAKREDTTTIPGKLQDVADRVKFGLGQLSSQMAKFTSSIRGRQVYRDFDRVTGDFDLHMQQTSEIREQFDKGLKALVPNKLRRIAITNYIEAGGDMSVLAQREAGSKTRFKRGYQIAQNLSPLEKSAADSLRLSYDDLGQRAANAGVLHSFLDDYVNHVYKQLPPSVGRAIQSVQSGTLRSNPSMAMRRVWDSFYEAEKNGAIPEKDIGWLHSHYVDSLERAIASRDYVRGGTESIEADGRKTFAVSGVASEIGKAERDPALLVRPHGVRGEDTTGYRQVNHSSMRKWQWANTDANGKSTFVQGDLLVHPDRYAEVKAMLESSKLRDSGVAQFALKATAAVKNSIFLMTGFHPLTLSFHGLERGAIAGRLDKLDVQNNQIQQIGVAHGLKLHDYDAAYTFGKGLEETNLFNSIPGFGRFAQAYQHWVFNDLQPRLKVTSFRMGLEANLKTYGGSLTHEQIAAKTAGEINNAFGGQNWQRMGVSKTAQDVLKLGFMAPDFLKSRAAYTAQSFRPDIHLEQTKSMWMRGGLGMYMGARILNQILDKDPHWDARDAFTVYSGGEKYTLRTAQQDFVGLLQNPHSFMTARVAPLGQTAVEAYTGRNEQGFERTATQQVQDLLGRTPQLTVQQYLNSPDASWWDSFRSSMGIHVHEAHTPAEDLALQFRAQAIPRGEQGDEERDRLKTLRSLRRLGSKGRTAEFEDMLSKGMDSGTLAQGDADKLYDNLGAEYLPQLVKGLDVSHALEVFRKASGDERGAIQDIVSDKLDRALDSDSVSQKVKDRMSREADSLFK